MALPFIIIVALKANRTEPRKTDPWACGFKYSSRMQMTASPFTGDLRRLMNWLYKSETHIEHQGYFKPVKYETHAKDIWWSILYEPIINFIDNTSNRAQKLQNGSCGLYSAYILGTLFLFLGLGSIL